MYEQHASSGASTHRSIGKQMDRPYLVRRSHSTPCSESDNNLEVHGGSSSSSNAPVTRSQSNKRIIPPYSNRSLANSPPSTPNKLAGSTGKLNQNNKLISLRIILLDDSVTIIQAQSKALGRVVFDQVCKQLNVLESDYFGLEYTPPISSQSQTSTAPSSPPPLSSSSSILNSSSLISTSAPTPTHLTHRSQALYWLDLEKRLTRQVAFNVQDPVLRFSVKFYTPDPSQLEEEFTRYLFSLQIKRDLQQGTLVCNDNTAALMASYIVQAECGDFSEEDYPDASYLSLYKFIPHQDYEIERKIRENHKKHIGQSPAEADLHLLETARRTELFGIRMHAARDEDGIGLNLSVCHNGLLVFQNFTKINTFSWAKIRKLSFKRKRFILKLHPEISDGYYKDLVEFIFDSRNDCKAYWKRCVEHHAFFRCEKAPNPIHRSKGLLSSRGSSFRYSGRTQKQMVQFVRENFVKRPNPSGAAQQQPTAASGGAVTTGGVLVPDVSSSDNNSFDNSIVSGGDGRGVEVRGGGSGRFQRSSSLRSAQSAHQQIPTTHHVPQPQEYNNVLSKSLSTIAGSKNYEEDTVIYTTRAEVAAAQRAAAASSSAAAAAAVAAAQQGAGGGPRGNNYYIGDGVRSRRGSAGGCSTSRSLGGDIDDGEEDLDDEEDEDEDDGELDDQEEEEVRGIIKRGGVRGSGGSRGSMGRAQSMDGGGYRGEEDEVDGGYGRPQSRGSMGLRSSVTDIYNSTKETQTPTHQGYGGSGGKGNDSKGGSVTATASATPISQADLEALESELIESLVRGGEGEDDSVSLASSQSKKGSVCSSVASSNVGVVSKSKVIGFGSHEFPVTTYKTGAAIGQGGGGTKQSPPVVSKRKRNKSVGGRVKRDWKEDGKMDDGEDADIEEDGGKVPVPKPRYKRFGSDGMIVDEVVKEEGGEEEVKVKSNTIPRVGKARESGGEGNSEGGVGLESNEGSYDLLSDASERDKKKKDFSVHFKEVDYVPYLLRRRIDLGEGGEELGSGGLGSGEGDFERESTGSVVKVCVSVCGSGGGSVSGGGSNHEVLGKSKSWGVEGGGGGEGDGATGSVGGLTRSNSGVSSRPVVRARMLFCSLQDLPPSNSYSFLDDTVDNGGWGGERGDIRCYGFNTVGVSSSSSSELVRGAKRSGSFGGRGYVGRTCEEEEKIEEGDGGGSESSGTAGAGTKEVEVVGVPLVSVSDEDERTVGVEEEEEDGEGMKVEELPLDELEEVEVADEEVDVVVEEEDEDDADSGSDSIVMEGELQVLGPIVEEEHVDEEEEKEEIKVVKGTLDLPPLIEEDESNVSSHVTVRNGGGQEEKKAVQEFVDDLIARADEQVARVRNIEKIQSLDEVDEITDWEEGVGGKGEDVLLLSPSDVVIPDLIPKGVPMGVPVVPMAEVEDDDEGVDVCGAPPPPPPVPRKEVERESPPPLPPRNVSQDSRDVVPPPLPPPPLRRVSTDSSTDFPLPPPPIHSQDSLDYIDCPTPRYPLPPELCGGGGGSRRSSYNDSDSFTATTTLIESRKVLQRSFSVQDGESAGAEGGGEGVASVVSGGSLEEVVSPKTLEAVDEAMEYIDEYDTVECSRENLTVSESTESSTTEKVRLCIPLIGGRRVLSRISEVTNTTSSTDQMSDNSFMEKIESGLRAKLSSGVIGVGGMIVGGGGPGTGEHAPLVTLTSELGDSSATLNDLDDHAVFGEREEVGVESEGGGGNVSEGVVVTEIVREVSGVDDTEDGVEGIEEDAVEDVAKTMSSSTGNTKRHRVTLELRVIGGEIIFDSN